MLREQTHIEAVLHRLRHLHWQRVPPVKLFSGALAMSSAG